MSSIDEILFEYDWKVRSENLNFNFRIIEEKIGFELPQDYRAYSIRYTENEGIIGNEFLRLWDLEDLIDFNIEYEITNNLYSTIAIGDNGSSEFIGVQFINENNYQIILSPFIDLNSEYNIIIGTSFSDFIKRLHEGKEWFI